MGETAALIVAAVAAAGSATMTVASANQAQGAAKIQRQQYEEEKRASALAAAQEEADKRRELNAVLSAQDTLRAGRGLDLMSSTGDAIRRDSVEQAENDILTIRLNSDRQARRYDLAGSQAKAQGNQAAMSGYASAAGTVGSFATSRSGMMSRSGR